MKFDIHGIFGQKRISLPTIDRSSERKVKKIMQKGVSNKGKCQKQDANFTNCIGSLMYTSTCFISVKKYYKCLQNE